MKNTFAAIILALIFFVITSCNVFTAQPTETPVPTSTYTPEPTATMTVTPYPTSTNTTEPTATLTITAIPATETPADFALPAPSGKPAAEWQDIPIMPDAIAGEGDSTAYSFTIDATVEEVQEYYEQELTKLGYSMFASGQGSTEAVILFFMKGEESTAVSIIPQPYGLMYVILVK